ncbi:hypothetical protein [Paenibacillus sp. sgz500958]|uniref:hypothetical protein n=1 Tax=Paenibacillus sp. sgz500958 TaxID=3242475 RepID=UPI0036D317EC
MFTNFISETTSESIKTSIYDIFDNPNIFDTPNAGEVEFNNKKIEECLKLYIDPFPASLLFIKSNLVDAMGIPKQVRVFSVMETISNPEPKAISKIVLIDPFHVVIPSKHDGKTKEEVERDTFRSNKDNYLCMNDYVKATLGF